MNLDQFDRASDARAHLDSQSVTGAAQEFLVGRPREERLNRPAPHPTTGGAPVPRPTLF